MKDPSIDKSLESSSSRPKSPRAEAPLTDGERREREEKEEEGKRRHNGNPAWMKPMENFVKPAPLPDDGSLPKEWVYMRVANVIGVVCMVLTGIVEFVAGATISTAILAIYAICFGCFLCCVELRIKIVAAWIATNFGFLYKSWGRITFLILCGFLMWSLDSIMGWLVGAYLIALAPANVYMLAKYPELEKKAIDYQKHGIAASPAMLQFAMRQQATSSNTERV